MKNIASTITGLIIIAIACISRSESKGFKCVLSNDRCALPFEFKGKNYDSCTTDGIDNGRSWCPTKMYKNGTADVYYCMECWAEQRCYYTADTFPDNSWLLTCPPGCFHVQKRVHGSSNEFSADSYVCAAAIHEGLITNKTGGVLNIKKSPWRKAFVGATKNGVRTYSARKDGMLRMEVQELVAIKPLPKLLLTWKPSADFEISSLQADRMIKNIQTERQSIGSITCDVRKKKVYWTMPDSREIKSADYDGNVLRNKKVLVIGAQVGRPKLIAVDWINGRLYWTDSRQHKISVSDLNGQDVQVVVQKDDDFDPAGIALDLRNGYLYVADGGTKKNILKCPIVAFGECETVIGGLDSPSGIAIDPDATTLCWTDKKTLSCADLDGSNKREMKFSEERLSGPSALVIFDDTVYWTDKSSTILASASLTDWNSFHIHYGDLDDVSSLTIFDERAQKIFASPPPRHTIDIYVADIKSVERFRMNTEEKTILSRVTVASGLQQANSVAVDMKKKDIYWSDSVDRKIYRTKSSTTPNVVIIDESEGYIKKPEGIAIDSANRLLYWTDIDLHAVFVCNLDLRDSERFVATIYQGDETYEPRGLAPSPEEGLLYVADTADPYRVQRCKTEYNGGCIDFLNPAQASRPNWIALNERADKIFVSSAGDDRLFWVSYLALAQNKIKSNRMRRPYGIGVHRDRVYISDTGTKSITAFDTTGENTLTIYEGLHDPRGIFLHDLSAGIGNNDCANHRCRYICVPAGQDRQSCLCPNKYRGKNDAEECKIIAPCSSNPCKNNGRCIDNARKTDYTCECPAGYGGKDCSQVDIDLIKEVDPETAAIYLKCIVPKGTKSQITWLHDSIEIDRSLHWVKYEEGNQQLTIERPRYLYSGEFACQIEDGRFVRRADLTLKIPGEITSACGQAPAIVENTATSKIRGGQITKVGDAPFVAMLHKETHHVDIGSGVFCGGAVLSTKHVITAAHCFDKVSIRETTVYVGKYVADANIIEKKEQSSGIKSIVVHEDYVPTSLHADFAILTMKSEFYFSAYVKPVCIADPTDKNDDITPRSVPGKPTKHGVVYGWGLTEAGAAAKQMREAIIPIKRPKQCDKHYKKGAITNLMFCAGGGQHGDACKGDSGGPFTLWSKRKNRWFLGGLVSKGEQCTAGQQGTKPGVYAKLGRGVRKWIIQITKIEI